MEIFTKEQFRSAVSSLSGRYTFSNVLNEARNFSNAFIETIHNSKDVAFLSPMPQRPIW